MRIVWLRVFASWAALSVLLTIGLAAVVTQAAPAPAIERSLLRAAVPDYGELGVLVQMAGSMNPIAGAYVQVFDSGGTRVAQGYTNSSGWYWVTLVAGRYKVRVSAVGFSGYAQSAVVIDSNEIPIRFQLNTAY